MTQYAKRILNEIAKYINKTHAERTMGLHENLVKSLIWLKFYQKNTVPALIKASLDQCRPPKATSKNYFVCHFHVTRIWAAFGGPLLGATHRLLKMIYYIGKYFRGPKCNFRRVFAALNVKSGGKHPYKTTSTSPQIQGGP